MSVSRVRCRLLGHRWVRVQDDEVDTSDRSFLRCRRCATENHEPTGVNGVVAWGWRPYT